MYVFLEQWMEIGDTIIPRVVPLEDDLPSYHYVEQSRASPFSLSQEEGGDERLCCVDQQAD